MSAPDVLVVGAGITGAVAAHELARAGARVEVIDAYGPAAMASGWTLAGVRQSGRDPAELPLAREAVRLWPQLEEILGAPTHYRQDGNLRLARTPYEVAVIRRLVDSQRAAGLDLSFLPERRDVTALAPVSQRVLAASYCPTDGHADPIATVNAFLGAAQRHGARLSAPERVHSLKVAGGRIVSVRTDRRDLSPGTVLLACGIKTNDLLAPLGVTIPLTVPIVTVVRTAPLPPLLRPVIGVANADLALRQEASGALRFTSGAEPFDGEVAQENGRPVVRPRAAALMMAIGRVADVLPAAGEAEVGEIWGGLLDLTPDALPVIDTVPGIDNLIAAAGFSGHGFGIGPVTGALCADLALSRAPRLSLGAFRFDRFADGARAPVESLSLHG